MRSGVWVGPIFTSPSSYVSASLSRWLHKVPCLTSLHSAPLMHYALSNTKKKEEQGMIYEKKSFLVLAAVTCIVFFVGCSSMPPPIIVCAPDEDGQIWCTEHPAPCN